jgi:hypothetical protein
VFVEVVMIDLFAVVSSPLGVEDGPQWRLIRKISMAQVSQRRPFHQPRPTDLPTRRIEQREWRSVIPTTEIGARDRCREYV